MGRVALRQGQELNTVEVEPQGDEGLAAELASLFLSRGGQTRGRVLIISPLILRLSAGEMGTVLKRHDASREYDPFVRRLLEEHVQEVEARREAESGKSISGEEVRRLLAGTRFTRNLKDKQVRDLGRLLALRHGANFSVPGAGKTTTLLALYESMHSQGKADRLLVVAPKNAFLSWEEEIDACFDTKAPTVERLKDGPAKSLATLGKDAEVYLITYQFLPNFVEPLSDWARSNKTHIVLDEAHRIKGGTGGIIAGSALRFAGLGVRRDILTGTPLPQSPEDLRPQLQFLWPGQRILPDYALTADTTADTLSELQRRVRPLYVRTTKEELHLPPLNIVPRRVELGPVQREIYELLRSEARRVSAGLTSKDRAYFRALGRHVVRLLQAASNPMLLTQNEIFDEDLDADASPEAVRAFDLLREFARYEKPAKVATAVARTAELLEEKREKKVLIWTSFISNIALLERLLKEYEPVSLYGAIGTGDEEDPETREGRIKTFHEVDECKVMIANPAACGESISLHRVCHFAIYLDRTFNAAHFMQSVDRIHRLGLKEGQMTNVEVLEAAWTIDSRVSRRLSTKISSMAHILNDPGLLRLAYDPEDVEEEFPGGLEPADVEEVVDHLVHDDGA